MFYIIEPFPIGDAQMRFSNVPENDYPVWGPAVSYAQGARVIFLATHKVYQATAAISTGPNNPPPNALFNAETNPAGKWIEVGATRRWKIFDGKINDYVQLGNETVLNWHIAPGTRVDSVALFGLRASHVRLQVIEGTNTLIWEEERELIDLANITDGWDYFRNDPAYHTEVVFRGIPADATHTLRIQVRNADNNAARVGEVVIGREVEVGTLLLGGGIGIQDFSEIEPDGFGDWNIVRRAYSDIATYQVLISAGRERYIRRRLALLRATPAVYHAGPDMTARGLTTYGFYHDVPVSLSSPTHSQLNIEIRGLT